MKILLSPHNDDETLFASFTVQREKPLVIVVFDSFLQVTRGSAYCDWETRRGETRDALHVLLATPPIESRRDPAVDPPRCFYCSLSANRFMTPEGDIDLCPTHDSLVGSARGVKFCGFRDDAPVPPWMIADKIQELLGCVPTHIWAPAHELAGHEQHNEVALAALTLMSRWADKPKLGQYLTYTRIGGKSRSGMPVPAATEMIQRKHLAMACYQSQIENPSTREWFMKDIEEYYA